MRLVSQLACRASETGPIPVRGANGLEAEVAGRFPSPTSRAFDSLRACNWGCASGSRLALQAGLEGSTPYSSTKCSRSSKVEQPVGIGPARVRFSPGAPTRVGCSTASTPAFQAGRDGSNPSTRTAQLRCCGRMPPCHGGRGSSILPSCTKSGYGGSNPPERFGARRLTAGRRTF
jgi:hypothetical protein